MKVALLIFVNNLVALALIGLAGFMMYNNIKHYGWIIAGAIICTSYATVKTKETKE